MKKIKRIAIKIEACGSGIVNFDSNDQKYLWNKVGRNQRVETKFENVSFGKKVWSGDKDNFDYKLKISEGCVKSGMFKDDIHSFSPSLSYDSDLLMTYITSEALVSRGYLFANKETIKRKGVLCLTGLVQSNDAVSTIELCSRGGEKIKKVDENDKADTSLFFRETVGDLTYKNDHVFINLDELQFICGDVITDRLAVSPEDQKKYIEFMRKRYGKHIPDFEYYRHATSSNIMPEIGVLLPNDVVVHLTKFLLKRLLGFGIYKSRAFVEMTSVKIKLVSDALDDLSSTDADWITLTPDVIDALDFEVYESYVREPDQLNEKQIRDGIAKKAEELKAIGNAENAEKKAVTAKLKKDKADKADAVKKSNNE